MTNPILPKSWWMCVDETSDGFGIPHMVVFVNNRSVDAWSDSDLDPNDEGYAWSGNRTQFLDAFASLDFELGLPVP